MNKYSLLNYREFILENCRKKTIVEAKKSMKRRKDRIMSYGVMVKNRKADNRSWEVGILCFSSREKFHFRSFLRRLSNWIANHLGIKWTVFDSFIFWKIVSLPISGGTNFPNLLSKQKWAIKFFLSVLEENFILQNCFPSRTKLYDTRRNSRFF